MASVSAAGALDSQYITASVASTGKKDSKSYMDFGKVVEQVRSKTYKSQTTNQKVSSKTENSLNQNVKKNAAVKDRNKNADDTSKTDVNDAAAQTVSDSHVNADNTDSPKLQDEVSENGTGQVEDISDAAKLVTDAAEEIIDTLTQQLEVTGEEILGTLEELGMKPVDLLNSDNIAEFMAAITGEDSTIGIVTDEDMYSSLKEVISLIDEKIGEIQNELGIEPDKVSDLLEQLKNFEDIQETFKQEDGIQNNAPDFDADILKSVADTGEKGRVPVILTKDLDAKQQDKLQTPETEEQQVRDTDGMKIEKEDSAKGEHKDYNGQQNQMQSFQNSIEELENLTESVKTLNSLDARDTQSILKQLADYIKVQNGKELTQMELQLHPASLGTVHIQLSSRGGSVTAQITAQNETVKNAIEAQVVQLRNNLEEQGVKVEAIEVSVASHELERNLEQGNQDQNNSERDNNNTGSISKHRKISINMNDYDNDEEMLEEMHSVDDAARIAMEMMAMHGNSMNLYA